MSRQNSINRENILQKLKQAKTFLGKRKLGELITNRHTIQEMQRKFIRLKGNHTRWKLGYSEKRASEIVNIWVNM